MLDMKITDEKLLRTLSRFTTKEIGKITRGGIRASATETKKVLKAAAPTARFKKHIGQKATRLTSPTRATAKAGINVGIRPASFKARDAERVASGGFGRGQKSRIMKAIKSGYADPLLPLLTLGTARRTTKAGHNRGRITGTQWVASAYRGGQSRILAAVHKRIQKEVDKSIQRARG